MRELPYGYVRVSVLVTRAEYERLEGISDVTPRGTMSEAVRYTMGWPYVPHGFLKAAGIAKTRPSRAKKKPKREPFAARSSHGA